MIAYTLWMLSTSANVRHVFEGTTVSLMLTLKQAVTLHLFAGDLLQPVTYVAIGFGSLFFTNGKLGFLLGSGD